MKTIALAVLAVLTFSSARAATIASCSSIEHHGHYVEIKDDNKKISISISNDGDDGDVPASVASISKSGTSLKDGGAQSWAIRQAIKGSLEVDMSGVIAIKGKIKKNSYLMNLNTYSGQHFLVIGDYVEELKCNRDLGGPSANEINSMERP